MKEFRPLIVAACIAVALALLIIVRISMQHKAYQRVVFQSLQTSEGYDQQLIEMVNKLEDELAMRASFGYKGGKDPMTGRTRLVVMPTIVPSKVTRRISSSKSPVKAEAPPAPVVAEDPIKLTAIIFDDQTNQFTAIVMDGERSMSVQIGDRVRDRVIVRITAQELFMESQTMRFKYDIYGERASQPK